MTSNPVLDAARRRAKRNKPEKARMAAFKAAVLDIETIGNGIATAQTLARAALRRNETPLARLKRTKKLNVWEECAIDEILAAHAIIAGQTISHDIDLGIRITERTSPDAGVVRRIDTMDKYREWKHNLAKTPALYVVTTVLFDEQSFRVTDRSNRWQDGTAFKHFREGLRHFAALRGNTPNGVKWRYVGP